MEIDLEVALAALAAAEAACVELEDTPERERERAAEAHGHAEAGGKDTSTERQIKYVAGKFSTWLSLHGEAHGYGDGDEPSVDLVKQFQSHCFVNRTYKYSVLGNKGMDDSFGALQVCGTGEVRMSRRSFDRLLRGRCHTCCQSSAFRCCECLAGSV